MSKAYIDELRAKFAVSRTNEFQQKLTNLLDEMAAKEQADEFILQALQPAAAQ